jgi:hypothetical protein
MKFTRRFPMSEETMAPQMSGDEIPPEEEERLKKKKRKRTIIIGINLTALVIIIVLVFLLVRERSRNKPVVQPSPSPVVEPSPSPEPTATPSALLKRINTRKERLQEKIEGSKAVENIKPPILDFELRFEIED